MPTATKLQLATPLQPREEVSGEEAAAALRDLMGLLALPPLWAGKDEKTILQLMVDGACAIDPVAVVYATVLLPPGYEKVALLRTGSGTLASEIPAAWHAFAQLCDNQAERSATFDSPLGTLTATKFYMGAGTKGECIWFASTAAGFPSPRQMAFLHAAVSLATTGLNTARIDLERCKANQRKDEFLAMLGHELRNPLAPLVSTLALIRLKGSGHLAREHAVMERQVNQLSRLVDDLLDITRVTSDTVVLTRELCDIRGAVMEAVESVAQLMVERKHQISVNIDSLDALVSGDPGRLHQVFVNLLVNAAKYTPPGGRVTITAVQDAATVSVSIHDNGSGIDSELLPRVFDLFEQGATDIDRSRGGLGIGLAIVKKLVSLHSGVATAQSPGLGQGATFTVSLPLQQQLAPVLPIAAIQASHTVSAGPQRILVVDDNLDALDSMEALLSCYGFEVLTAHGSTEALAKSPGFEPDTFVLDIGLPGLDGYQLAAELRRVGSGKTQAAQFIALTGYGQDNDKARSLAAGFHRHLVKPVQIDDLLAAIRDGADMRA